MRRLLDHWLSPIAFQVATVVALVVAAAAGTPPYAPPWNGGNVLPPIGTVQEVRVVGVVDGDTYDVEPIAVRIRVRLANADTWESRHVQRTGSGTISDEEIEKGKAATAAVIGQMNGRHVYLVTRPGEHGEPTRLDNFGRTLAEVLVSQDGTTATNLGDWLRANGHTRR